MWRTRVGYAGGTTAAPTYHDLGDHSEAIQIAFDPAVVTYRELLALFVAEHNPCATPWSRQYASAVFWHSDAQRDAARDVLDAYAATHGTVRTRAAAFTGFTPAEDYHQKYRLRGTPALLGEVSAWCPDDAALRDSTVAARLNGWLAGEVDPATFDAELAQCGLSDAAQALLRRRVGR